MTDGTRPRAVVLLSGGLDSATCVAIARADGFEPCALTVEYGQRHARELQAARAVVDAFGIERHETARVDLGRFGGSALTDDIPVPHDGDSGEDAIPVTYVPARNTVLLSMALAWAETIGAADIFIGANAVDYSGYPDCRPAFIEAFESLANLATKVAVEGHARFRVHAPLLHLTKAAIIQRGTELGVDYGLTWSCYDPTPAGRPCEMCDSCRLREKGFEAAGLTDPLVERDAD